MNRVDRCETCKFFNGDKYGGQCKKDVPFRDSFGNGSQPWMQVNDWCGEWKPASPPDNVIVISHTTLRKE